VIRDTFIATPPKARVPQQVVEALDTLPLEERQVILLRCVADMSLNEAGYVLGKSNAAVKQLQVQALQAINTLFR
jgi:DNA-directed RNA polymerase specialized sigma24 family protein